MPFLIFFIAVFLPPATLTLPDQPIIAETAPIVLNSTTTISAFVKKVQLENGLNDSFYKTLECESEGWQNIQSQIKHKGGPNGQEDSWGTAQIHLPAHPEVTRKEAMNPEWAINWAATQFKRGNAWEWSCYNNHSGYVE